jgi:hypothetical protein
MSFYKKALGFVLSPETSIKLGGMAQEAMYSRLVEPPTEPPAHYAKIFPSLREFHEEKLSYKPEGLPSEIGLWVRPPDDETKPTYVVFHGLTGNWAKVGMRMTGTYGIHALRGLTRWRKQERE